MGAGEEDNITLKIKPKNSILAFNFGKESFSLVPYAYDVWSITGLGCLGSCLIFSEYSGTGVWMLKDYGNKESWIKFATFTKYYWMDFIPADVQKEVKDCLP
ncbi:hypothetical protein ACH5RR_006108 [Cinchona calisaya]|uniref:F-box protein n=1 Tax=Cinchona calisaya TaxID=153742 RepID=A0ABD3AN90_9GENT